MEGTTEYKVVRCTIKEAEKKLNALAEEGWTLQDWRVIDTEITVGADYRLMMIIMERPGASYWEDLFASSHKKIDIAGVTP